MTPPDLRIEAGRPTPEELAAVTAALATALVAEPQPARRSGWLAATRRENLGEGVIASPADLDRH